MGERRGGDLLAAKTVQLKVVAACLLLMGTVWPDEKLLRWEKWRNARLQNYSLQSTSFFTGNNLTSCLSTSLFSFLQYSSKDAQGLSTTSSAAVQCMRACVWEGGTGLAEILVKQLENHYSVNVQTAQPA